MLIIGTNLAGASISPLRAEIVVYDCRFKKVSSENAHGLEATEPTNESYILDTYK